MNSTTLVIERAIGLIEAIEPCFEEDERSFNIVLIRLLEMLSAFQKKEGRDNTTTEKQIAKRLKDGSAPGPINF